MNATPIEFWVDQALVLYIVNMLLMKAVLLRRETRLGFWLAVNNLAFALIYVGVLLREWVDPLNSEAWMWGVHALIGFTATMVVLQFRRTFGGWRALHREMVRSLTGKRPPPEREGY